MGKKLFVGNLSWGASEESLSEFFTSVGAVVSAKIITDRETGKSRGFGFVEMSTEEEANRAIAELEGKNLDGRPLHVSEAVDKGDRPRRDNSGGQGYGRERREHSFEDDREGGSHHYNRGPGPGVRGGRGHNRGY